MSRKKIAIFVDQTLRTPSFSQAYSSFKDFLFQDNFGVESDEESRALPDTIRYYWQKELEKEGVLKFYTGIDPEKINDTTVNGKYESYFFNKEHFLKFIEQYSFNIFSDAVIPCKRDIAIINIAQTSLFDVYLFDRVINSRKVPNTLYFLSKSSVFVKSVNFIGIDEQLNEEEFFAIWEPEKNSDQVNKEGSDVFFNWFKKIEEKYNESKK